MQHRRFAKNAVANLGRGSAAAIVALLLPPVLVRHMAPAAYAAWVLALQIVAYVGYLDFGLQTAVGRYIAFANERKDSRSRDSIFSTAFAGLSIAAVLGIILVLIVVAECRVIFPSVPPDLLWPMRVATFIVGVSVALGLPASAWNGVFAGLQRYDIPALTTTAGRLLSALGLIWAAFHGKSLVFMAAIVAGANFFSYALQFTILRRRVPEIQFQPELVTKPIIRELAGYSFSLTVWSFSMLLVTGFDLLLVGRFQFNAVTPYSVSATLITFLAGAQTAIFGVIMPHAAELQARQDSAALGNLLVKTTKLGVLLLLLTGLPLIVFAQPIIKAWIGAQYAESGGRILVVLVIANMVRLIGAPYATILIGTGQQRLVTVSPLMEGGSNLLASILLAIKYGAVGVAGGTLVGAVVGMLGHVLYNMPRTKKEILVSPLHYIFSGIALPALATVPLVWLALRTANGLTVTGLMFGIAMVLTLIVSSIVVLFSDSWRFLNS